MDDSAARTPVQWREWGEAAFEEAREANRPVLCSLSARWCGWCHEMDRRSYDDPRIAAAIHDGFVPVRVDADRRPGVRERYNAGGFPSTVALAPTGEVLLGTTYLGPDELRGMLDRARAVWDERGADAGQVPESLRGGSTPAGEVTRDVGRYLAGQLEAQFDDHHAGWGDDAKFPLPETIRFALKRDRARALASLDAVREHLLDADGGVFRYAAGRDWSDPQREKLLGTNAGVLRACADAYLSTGEDAYRETASRIADYLSEILRTGDGLGGSQAPPGDGNAVDSGSAVDPTRFADGNALAADALLALHAYTDDGDARDLAERTLAFLADELVDADGVVTHYVDASDAPEAGESSASAPAPAPAPPSPRCRLADQAAVARAFATATQVLGPDHLPTARAVADAAIDRLQEPGGAFLDGPPGGPGLLDRPLRPVDDAATMADALVDLAVLSGEERYWRAARDAIAAFAGAADRMGVQLAAYGTAAARVVEPPLAVVVATPPGSDLHRAALRMADHEKVVVPSAGLAGGLRTDLGPAVEPDRDPPPEPDRDPVPGLDPGVALEPGQAALLVDGDLVGPAATPAALAALVSDLVDRE